MLKAIRDSEDIVAAREKTIQVIEKLRALRLSPLQLVPGAAEPNRKQRRKPSQKPPRPRLAGHGHDDFPELTESLESMMVG
jgi:hypothetical protein